MRTSLLTLSALVVVLSVVALQQYIGHAWSHEANNVTVIKKITSAGDYTLYEIQGSLGPKAARLVERLTHPSKTMVYAKVYPTYPDPALWRKASSKLAVLSWSMLRPPYVELGSKTLVWLPSGINPRSLAVKTSSPSDKDNTMIIIVGSRELEPYAEELRELHSRQGIRVEIVSMDWIIANYKPAPMPPYTLDKKHVEEYSVGNYSLDHALRLVSFLREVAKEGRAKYILLLGNASTIPPFYYKSTVLSELVSPKQGIVATDYWYMDPDYDFKPDLAVGRLPLEGGGLEAYISLASSWIRGGSWEDKVLMTGGATFAWILMMGESLVADASKALMAKAPISFLLLTMGNYTPSELSSSIGVYGYYLIASHGSGRAFVDYVPKGVWGYEFEEKLSVDKLPPKAKPGVYVSPACLTAWWDYSIIEPGFLPPSIGVALLSRAAVAYVGPTRIAFEFITSVKARVDGSYDIGYYGAMRLVQLYASWLANEETLGEAYLKAIASYITLPYTMLEASTPYGSEKLGLLTALEFTFLGDPALPNPLSRPPTGPLKAPPKMSIVNSTSVELEAVITEFTAIAEGELPLVVVKPGSNITLEFSRCPSALMAIGLDRYYSDVLIDLRRAVVKTISSNGACRAVVELPEDSSSVYTILYRIGSRLERRIVTVLGYSVWLDPVRNKLVVEASGLDLLRVVGSEPLYIVVNGRIEGVIPGGSSYTRISIDAKGLEGNVAVSIVPVYDYSLIVGGRSVYYAKERIASMLRYMVFVRHRATMPLDIKVVAGNNTLYVLVTLLGKAIDANLTVVLANNTSLKVEKLGPGFFRVPSVPVNQLLVVRASYVNATIEAHGETIYYSMSTDRTMKEKPIASKTVTTTTTITETTTITLYPYKHYIVLGEGGVCQVERSLTYALTAALIVLALVIGVIMWRRS